MTHGIRLMNESYRRDAGGCRAVFAAVSRFIKRTFPWNIKGRSAFLRAHFTFVLI
ncbi:hypothetical protein DSM25559_1711 [Agrobacterium rosae]|uniref:Uncharacterized protein n=1 Tax=Agrobacterium rosae TaxID=1972867 RepID=A0A1R3TIS2_9HYPH|nr:hypothetical protein DSM25559_1711 [Agrobacterium rosae]